MKPISPSKVDDKKNCSIPDAVIEVFNKMIVEKWDGHEAVLKQPEILVRIKKKMKIRKSKPIFDNKWLDVEDLFRKEGWKVEYDKPAYNEDYDALFTFSRGKKCL